MLEFGIGCSTLSEAALANDAAAMQALLQAGADPDERCASGSTPLIESAGAGSLECMQLLLRAGASTESANREGASALMIAASCAMPSAVELLLKAGAIPAARDPRGFNALTYAAFSRCAGKACALGACCSLLLDAGCDPFEFDQTGGNPAIWAAENGCAPCLAEILGRGCPEFGQEGGRRSLLMSACHSGKLDCALLLLGHNKQNLEMRDREGKTALILAASSGEGSLPLCKALLDAGADVRACDESGKTALEWCAAVRHPEAIELLLERGACANRTDHSGKTPLIAAASSHSANAQRLIGALLRHGADPGAANPLDGNLTAAHQAIMSSNFPALKLLLDAGANPNARTASGLSLLGACIARNDDPASELLLSNGADPNLESRSGLAPLAQALMMRNLRLAQKIAAAGAASSPEQLDAMALRAQADGWPEIRAFVEALREKHALECSARPGAKRSAPKL